MTVQKKEYADKRWKFEGKIERERDRERQRERERDRQRQTDRDRQSEWVSYKWRLNFMGRGYERKLKEGVGWKQEKKKR